MRNQSQFQQTDDLFQNGQGFSSMGEAVTLEPPISEDDYVLSLADEEGLDDLFLDQLASNKSIDRTNLFSEFSFS